MTYLELFQAGFTILSRRVKLIVLAWFYAFLNCFSQIYVGLTKAFTQGHCK